MDDPAPPPPPPDPVATARAQSQYNTNTAISQQLLNQTDQITPYGTLTYDQTGTSTFVGADGKTYTIPKFQATTTLTPEQQGLLDLTNRTKTNLGNIGVNLSGRVGDLLGTNLNLDTAAEDKLTALAAKRLDPLWARNEESLRTRLSNSGIQPGSEAWNDEMRSLSQARNDAYNQMFLQGRGQGVSEALTERNQPINELTALMSGSAVSQPNFTNTPTTGVGGVDYAGIVNNNYQGQLAAYKIQQASNAATMGGLFGLAGTIGGAALGGPMGASIGGSLGGGLGMRLSGTGSLY